MIPLRGVIEFKQSRRCVWETQKTLLVKFNQRKYEGGVTNLEKNEVAIIILITVCTDKTT